MMSSQFNAIDYAQQLEDAGVPKAQAEVHARTLAQVVGSCVTLPADLYALEDKLTTRIGSFEERITARVNAFEDRVTARMNAFEDRVTARMNAFEERITARMTAFEAQINARIEAFESSVKSELAEMRLRMERMQGEINVLKWICGTNSAMLIAIILKVYFP